MKHLSPAASARDRRSPILGRLGLKGHHHGHNFGGHYGGSGFSGSLAQVSSYVRYCLHVLLFTCDISVSDQECKNNLKTRADLRKWAIPNIIAVYLNQLLSQVFRESKTRVCPSFLRTSGCKSLATRWRYVHDLTRVDKTAVGVINHGTLKLRGVIFEAYCPIFHT